MHMRCIYIKVTILCIRYVYMSKAICVFKTTRIDYFSSFLKKRRVSTTFRTSLVVLVGTVLSSTRILITNKNKVSVKSRTKLL